MVLMMIIHEVVTTIKVMTITHEENQVLKLVIKDAQDDWSSHEANELGTCDH